MNQNQQKSIPNWIWFSLNSRFFKYFNFHQLTTSIKDAENLHKDLEQSFEVASSSSICLGGAEAKISAQNRENLRIKDDKIPIFFGFEIEAPALNYLKRQMILTYKPRIFILFYKDQKEFWKKSNEESNLLLIESNLDSRHSGCVLILNAIINDAKKWAEAKELNVHPGLPNIGNTCYMNSLIQVFSIMPEFEYVLNSINSSIFAPLANIIRELRMRNKNFNYRQYLQEFQSQIIENFHMFAAGAQHDSKELYNVLIDEIVSKFENFQEKFTIITNKCFYCIEIGIHDPAFKQESQLFLIMPDKSLENIDKHIKKIHHFKGENQLWCENCNEMRDMMLKVENVKYPLNLAIYLPENRVSEALRHRIRLGNNDYDLYAVICHSGNNVFGHYWAHLLINGKWIECNDSYVKENSPNLSNCYMLFYSKVNP